MKRATSKLVGLLVLSLLLVMFSNVITVKAEAATIIVPDDYSTIQAAINNAAEGDTVFVRNGVYQVDIESLIVINKTVSLIGEDPENTVILGVFGIPSSSSTVAIRVAAPNVTISGFTIRNCLTAISIANYYDEPFPSGCRIINNNIVNNSEGIRPQRSNVLISGNNITENQGGITGWNTENVDVTENNITNNYYGINTGQSRNVTVCRNNISGNTGGLNLIYYGPYAVYGNTITKNDWGIRFAEGCHNATVCGNNITQNDVGVVLLNFPNSGDVVVSGVGNKVFGNLFVDNSEQVTQDELDYNIPGTWSMGTDIVLWDNGTMGNYWDDYAGLDENGDEIGDTPYVIDENNQDNCPSMYPVDISVIPEFPKWIILPLLATMILVILIYRKNMKLSGQMGGSKVNSSFFSGDNSRGS